MRIHDISLTISPDLPTWPGDPKITLERVEKLELGANANVTRMDMCVHTGTHVDAPYHFLADGISVDRLPVDLLIGRAYVLELPEVDLVTAKVLAKAPIPPRTRRILFKTHNSMFWVREETAFQDKFVALSADAARYLANRGVKLVGVDYLSVAPYQESRPTHEILLKAGIVILEGLDLSQVSQGKYTLYCLPLKLAGSDGAPARAILVGV